MDQRGEITRLLHAAASGDAPSFDQAVALVHGDLERIARRQLARAYGARVEDMTLVPSALVNETFLRLVRQNKPFENRAHLVAVATRIMLRALVDYQRERSSAKRGGGSVRVTLSDLSSSAGATPPTASALSEALDALEELDARKCEVVKMRAIWGFDMKEIAELLGVSLPTVERDWRFARAWLIGALRERA